MAHSTESPSAPRPSLLGLCLVISHLSRRPESDPWTFRARVSDGRSFSRSAAQSSSDLPVLWFQPCIDTPR